MVITVVGDLTTESGIIGLHDRLRTARGEIAARPPSWCLVDIREVSEYGVNTVTMIGNFMQWFNDHYPCGNIGLLI
jgi:hypothetical protein